MKKSILLISLLLIGSFVFADDGFPDFPMTIYGDIKIGSTDLVGGTMKIYNSSNNELASFNITTEGKYGSNKATEEHLLLNKFDGSLTFKVNYNGKNYVVDSIDDSNRGEGCPSKSSITFVSANCRYDITLKEETTTSNGGNNGGGNSGGGGGGDGSSEKDNSKTTIDSGTKVDTGKKEETKSQNENKTVDNKSSSENISIKSENNLWYQEGNQSEILSNGYSREFNNAYEFAHRNGITTMDNINKADMDGGLTRIAMAKMLSNYAINILGKKPANKIVPKFPDVTQKLNDDYGGAVDLAYQLGIMGIGTDRFRPYDPVTRKEFGTALSRMLFGLADGTMTYYSTHLKKLKAEGIIVNDNPDLRELRGYVMLMLMRSALK